MEPVHNRYSGFFLSLVFVVSFSSGSNAQEQWTGVGATGIMSARCSGFSWPESYGQDPTICRVTQEIPLPLDISLLDEMCEDPACVDAGVDCIPGNCSVCVPITDNYTNTISFFTSEVPGSGSLPLKLKDRAKCTVEAQNASDPGHYPATCVSANTLVGMGNVYYLEMHVMDHTNTILLVNTTKYVIFGAGNPVVENTWAEFEVLPVGINHRNMLQLWMRDRMNNTCNGMSGSSAPFQPVPFSLTVTTWGGEPAQLQFPPALENWTLEGFYTAPIVPLYIGDYMVSITVGNIHISNSPLYFTAGTTYGILTRQPSSSTPLMLVGFLPYLAMLLSPAGTLSCLLRNSKLSFTS